MEKLWGQSINSGRDIGEQYLFWTKNILFKNMTKDVTKIPPKIEAHILAIMDGISKTSLK